MLTEKIEINFLASLAIYQLKITNAEDHMIGKYNVSFPLVFLDSTSDIGIKITVMIADNWVLSQWPERLFLLRKCPHLGLQISDG